MPIVEPAGPKANPLVAGRRSELERECLRLCADEAADSGRDGFEVMRDASMWLNPRTGRHEFMVNPATMTDDRLIRTLLELRAARADRKARE